MCQKQQISSSKIYLFYFKSDQINKQHMVNKLIMIHMFLIIILLLGKSVTLCPHTVLNGFILSGRVIAGLKNGEASLNQDRDHLCYNYTLTHQMQRPPEIAISVQAFQVQPTNKLNFYIKSIKLDSSTFIPFIIRTEWEYTKWSQITFNFIVEDRTDLESGYYLVDTGSLSSCQISKSIEIILPLKTIFNFKIPIKHFTFLHGFQITTVAQQTNIFSPFQIQMANSRVNMSNILISLSVRSRTKIDFIYIGYVVIQIGNFRFQGGNYTYLYSHSGESLIGFQPQTQIPKNYARLYGINGFIIRNSNAALSINTKWNSFSFVFEYKKQDGVNINIQYFDFNYVFFLGSECDQCPQYPFQYDGNCVRACPFNTVLTNQNSCINCGPNKMWNGTKCIKICPQTQYLNPLNQLCQCPPGQNWNGYICIFCTNGKQFNAKLQSCQCPNNLNWNGQSCALIPACTKGKIWDVFTYSCQCPESFFWNGAGCIKIPTCYGGQVLNLQKQCVCKQNFHWNGVNCNYSPCLGGQLWTGSYCACPIGTNFNTSHCLQCINGQIWNKQFLKCQCQSGYKWNGNYCQKNFICQGNRYWNTTYEKCICKQGFYWSGSYCIPVLKCTGQQYFDIALGKCLCLSPSKWNGKNCVNCFNGKIWNFQNLSCQCPVGSKQTLNGCEYEQKCSGGKNWVSLLKSCQCPVKTYWNGNNCIRNPCSNGRVWNQRYRACQCPNFHLFINNTCVPPQIACTNGRIWNPSIYSCECPPGTFPNIANCDKIPQCSGGKIYNPRINTCQCPIWLQQNFSNCIAPKCGQNQYFNGLKCQMINCPPPSYFFNNRCVFGLKSENCLYSQYWNGERCVYYPNLCPFGTVLQNFRCVPMGSCVYGQYFNNQVCTPLPQLCNPPLIWNGNSCKANNNNCPLGLYWSNNKCIPYVGCKNGFVWNQTLVRCVCPLGKFSNGQRCIQCFGQKQWSPGLGCICPDGSFDSGVVCQKLSQSKCSLVRNSFWNINKCVCRPGFIKINFECVCQGIQIGQLCDRCSHKPNSQWISFQKYCRCKKDYVQFEGMCIYQYSKFSIGNQNVKMCVLGTYFNSNIKICLPCPNGCLSCNNSNTCQLCKPQFLFDFQTNRCFQICGDGKKFNHKCDDGNNNDGDGCSLDCKLQKGYVCSGGSPQSPDKCYMQNYKEVSIQLIGQIRQQTSIVLMISINYLPKNLIYSPQCSNSCNIFDINLISDNINVPSITTRYVLGSTYLFLVNVQFANPYFQKFNVQIGIKPIIGVKYYGNTSTKRTLRVLVNPAYLSIVQSRQKIN